MKVAERFFFLMLQLNALMIVSTGIFQFYNIEDRKAGKNGYATMFHILL